MSVTQFLSLHLAELHKEFDAAVGGLTLEQLHRRPGPQTNHAAFVVWHCARTEDNVVQFIVQRKPTLWMEQGWDRRFGLDPRAQGTGMSPEEAGQVRFPSVGEMREYMMRAFEATEQFVAGLVPEALARPYRVRRTSGQVEELSLEYMLGTILLTHGFSHLGELWVLRGLQGLRGTA